VRGTGTEVVAAVSLLLLLRRMGWLKN